MICMAGKFVVNICDMPHAADTGTGGTGAQWLLFLFEENFSTILVSLHWLN